MPSSPHPNWLWRAVQAGFLLSWVLRVVALLAGVDGAWANVITLTNLVFTGGFLVMLTRARGVRVR